MRTAIEPLALSLLLAAGGCGTTPASDPGDATGPLAIAPPTAAPNGSTPAASASSPTPAAEPAASGPLASLAWLAGSWTGKSAQGATVEETWSAPAGTTMTGSGRTAKSDGGEAREALRIEAREGGAIVYVAHPDGQPVTEFVHQPRLAGPSAATFANDAHDWPTRIRYERSGDELRVTLKGRPGQAAETWTLQRKR